jgi:hypothetical protein
MEMIYVDWANNTIRNVLVAPKSQNDGGFCRLENGDYIHKHSLFPLDALKEIQEICDTRARLKKEYDDSIGLVYRLNNQYHGKKGI